MLLKQDLLPENLQLHIWSELSCFRLLKSTSNTRAKRHGSVSPSPYIWESKWFWSEKIDLKMHSKQLLFIYTLEIFWSTWMWMLDKEVNQTNICLMCNVLFDSASAFANYAWKEKFPFCFGQNNLWPRISTIDYSELCTVLCSKKNAD